MIVIDVETEEKLRAEVTHALESAKPIQNYNDAGFVLRFVTETAMRIARVCYAKGFRDAGGKQ